MKKITSRYWQDRQSQYIKNIERDEEKLFKQLSKFYNKEAEKLDTLISSYYTKYGEDNVIEYKTLLSTLPPSERTMLIEDSNSFFDLHPDREHLRVVRNNQYKINRLEAINHEITKQQIELGIKEEQLGKEVLTKGYEKTYNKVIKDMGFDNRAMIRDKNFVATVVNDKWLNNQNFSDRLWSNKDKLINYMTNDFKEGIIRGDSYQKMGKLLRERFEKRSTNDIKRLVYTEGTFVQNQAMKQPFEDMGFTHYYYDALLDDRTTEVCEGLSGQRFAFAEASAGENFPPMHSWCRSTFTVDLESRIDLQEEDIVAELSDNINLIDEMNSNGWFGSGSVDLDGMSDEVVDVVYNQHKKVFDKFPELKGQFKAPTVGNVDGGQAQYLGGTGSGQITLNKSTFKDYEMYKRMYQDSVAAGHFPKGLNADSAIMHEMGHAIDDYLTMDKYAGGFNKKTLMPIDSSQMLRTQVLKELKMNQGNVGEHLSNYATKNNKEFFAEAFSEYMNSNSPRPVARVFGEKLEKLMKEVLENE